MKVIKFYAEWCGPCKAYGPTFDKVANDPANSKIDFDSIDIDKFPHTVDWLKTMHKGKSIIPTTVFIHEDGEMDVAKGPLTEGQITRRLK